MGLFDWFRRDSSAARRDWLDTAVRVAADAAARHQGLSARRSFEAAETPAWTESWSSTAAELNDDLSRQLPILRARARAQARNNEWAKGHLIHLRTNVLGHSGIRMQSRVRRRDGSADQNVNDRIESAWAEWGRRGTCDVTGRYSWQQIEALALETLERDGELLYRLPRTGPHGVQVHLLNPAVLDHELNRDWQGRRIRMGVEITDDARPVAYWLRAVRAGDMAPDLITVGRHVRVPADQIYHFFEAEECDQLRGYPRLSTGARRLWQVGDFEQAAAVASANAAKREGFFVSPSGEAPPGFADVVVSSVLEQAQAAGKELTADEIQRITQAAHRYSTTMPGQFDTLPSGYDFKAFSSNWPNLDAAAYVKQQLRAWSAARGRSYVTTGNDLEAVNYSSARVGITDEREYYKVRQADLIRFLHEPVAEVWLRMAMLTAPGLLGLPNESTKRYQAARTWQPRRWAGIDPLKEAQSEDLRLARRTTSPQRIMLERGDDPDEIAAEIAEWEARVGPLDGSDAPERNFLPKKSA